MKWKNVAYLFGLIFILNLVQPSESRAEGYGDPWSGLYNTGGYNLLYFGNDLYNTNQYFSNNYPTSYYGGSGGWGGSCGSFTSSCNSPYNSSGLYGNNWGLGGLQLDFSLNLNLNFSSYPSYYDTGYYNSCGSWAYSSCGSDWWNNYSSMYDVGCSVGYCSQNSYFPYSGSSLYGNNGWNWGSGYNSYPWTYPSNITVNLNGYDSYQAPTLPTWGGCDGVIVPCPIGTVDPYQPSSQPYQPYYPTYEPRNQYVPVEPIRYKIPRGGLTTH